MGKHLSYPDRKYIQDSLDAGKSLSAIAQGLGKAASTISREIRAHRLADDSSARGRIKNRCVHRFTCKTMQLCEDNPDCVRLCRTCKACNSKCENFIEEHCSKLDTAPYVCNGCPNKQCCTLMKFRYSAADADKDYRKTLSECRSGFNLTDEELNYIDELCSPLLKQGQSVYHIVSNHRNELFCSERTLYRLVDASALSARNIDMPRVCRLKPRKAKSQTAKIDRSCRLNRTMKDFKSFMSEHPGTGFSEMDSVIGKVGGKLLLTINIDSIDFMLAFLRDHNTASSVEECFSFLRETLPKDVYHSLFYVLLTDNGSEFTNPALLECDSTGNQVSHLFYCDPGSPYQKPHVELNHEFIRRVIPKGTPMDNLEQEDIDLMMSHINSYGRDKFAGKSPTQMFVDSFGEDVLHSLRQELIPCDEILLKPSLLNK